MSTASSRTTCCPPREGRGQALLPGRRPGVGWNRSDRSDVLGHTSRSLIRSTASDACSTRSRPTAPMRRPDGDATPVLYGLHAILRLHFAQEEEAYAWLASADDDPSAPAPVSGVGLSSAHRVVYRSSFEGLDRGIWSVAGGVVRQEHPERCATAGHESATHAPPSWSSAKRATSASPTPTPDRCGDEVSPCRNASKDLRAVREGRPGRPSSMIRSARRLPTARPVPRYVPWTACAWPRSPGGSRRSVPPSPGRTRSRWTSSSRPPCGRRGARNPRRAPRPGRPRPSAGTAGSMMPRVSRSRSSRSVTSRSSLRAFCAIRRARSRISSCSRCRSSRAIVTARPRIPASGVLRSWETACRNVFFISSTARSRCAASRSAVSTPVPAPGRACAP